MGQKKRVWLLQFCDGSISGMTRCYLHDGMQGFRLNWNDLGSVRTSPDLQQQGIYFVVQKHGVKAKPFIYVGQATMRKKKTGMLNRLKEHRRNNRFQGAEDIVFLPTPDAFGATELDRLEHEFYNKIVNAGSYDSLNDVDPQCSSPRDDIAEFLDDFIEKAEEILAIFGHRPFVASDSVGHICEAASRRDSNPVTSTKLGKTQLAKMIVRASGNKSENAFRGILNLFNCLRPCRPTSKWRKPLEEFGVKFDSEHFVSDWKCAKVRG